MNVSIKKLGTTLTVCSLIIVMQIRGSESNFTRQWGAMGTLHQAPTYFTTYQPKKSACHKKDRTNCIYSQQVAAEKAPAKAPKK